jgi:hypothetical protein
MTIQGGNKWQEEKRYRNLSRDCRIWTNKEGAELLSMGLHSFEELAKDAKAIYRIKRRVLINIDVVYE